jgi:glycosyltransferase involved in cell wall biosynthesis
VKFSREGREAFRREHGFEDRFLVMYAGNHSPCHPLDTVLEAALRLKARDELAFCFVGGGSEHAKVKRFASRHELGNVKCLPYQPLEGLAGSLSAADLHLVVMGDEFVGVVHPSKIYNVMAVGAPVLYVGPGASHVVDIAMQNGGRFFLHRHGDVEGVVRAISEGCLKWKAEGERHLANLKTDSLKHEFSKQIVLPQLITAIGGNTVENLFRSLPDSDNRLTDYHAAH